MTPKPAPQRNTKQKKAVSTIFEKADGPLSVQQVLDLARADVPRLSLGTVYRIVNAMVAAGDLDLLQLPGEPPLFELATDRDHHFFRCRYCGEMIEIPGRVDILEKFIPEGCKVEFHELYLAGKCAKCISEGRDTIQAGSDQESS